MARSKRLRIFFCCVDQVVRREAAELRGEKCAPCVCEFLCVYARLEAHDLSRLEHAPCRIDTQRTDVAERVATGRKFGARREHLVYDHVDVTGGRIGVRSE